MVEERYRKWLVATFALFFTWQTYVIYSEKIGHRHPINNVALQGEQIWLGENCQVCHEIYGQGGHLGPDLTNVVRQMNEQAFGAILKSGPGPMPSFKLSNQQVWDLFAFFKAINRTGVGEPKQIPADGGVRLAKIPWFEYGASKP